jgi:hypothetical protein
MVTCFTGMIVLQQEHNLSSRPQDFFDPADNKIMNVSAVSSSYDSLAMTATSMKSNDISSQLSTAILKQIMDNQKMVADALTQMIAATPSASGTGSIVDIRA